MRSTGVLWMPHYQPSQQETICKLLRMQSSKVYTPGERERAMVSSGQSRSRHQGQLRMPHFTGCIKKLDYNQRKSFRMVNGHMKAASQTRKSLAWRRKDQMSIPRAECSRGCSRKETGTLVGVSDRRQVLAHIWVSSSGMAGCLLRRLEVSRMTVYHTLTTLKKEPLLWKIWPQKPSDFVWKS